MISSVKPPGRLAEFLRERARQREATARSEKSKTSARTYRWFLSPAGEFEGVPDGQRRGSGAVIILRVLMLQCRRVTGESLERPGSFLA
jgi:hypothetical protein